jgi:ubiquinone/menaquinone biosynthesis C-methylase UbiE
MNSNFWHSRFTQQAKWTASTRDYLFSKAGISPDSRVLEVGCGTGAVLSQLPGSHQYGLDINTDHLNIAKITNLKIIQANALNIPFPDNYFDIVYLHYFLLWVNDPMEILNEIYRVTKNKGNLIAIAEPDYSGRIDFPNSLNKLGELQTRSLISQGADPFIGKKLPFLFSHLDVTIEEFGVINGLWSFPQNEDDFKLEWQVINHDLSNTVSSEELRKCKELEIKAHQNKSFVRFIPTFYLLATKN